MTNQDWSDYARCREVDPELFFPNGSTGPAALQIQEAVAVCRTCRALADCRAWALSNREQHGVWGGMSEQERQRIFRRRARAAAS